MGSQVGIEDLLRDALSEEARAASEQMADIEFDDEIQTRLPEDLRYGGLYGLMSYLGMHGQGDQEGSQGRRAVIRPMGMPSRNQRQKMANVLGHYAPPTATEEGLARDARRTLGFDFYQGSYPKPDEVRYFQSSDRKLRDEGGRLYSGKEYEGYGGFGGLDDLSITINHELFHRAQSLPFFEDRLKELELEMEGVDQDSSEGRAEYRRLNKERARLYSFINESHYYLDAFDAAYPNTPKERKLKKSFGGDRLPLTMLNLRKLQEDTRRYLTPEKQKELGVRLPTPAAKPKEPPSLVERAIDYAKDIF